jgi:hypothetical protein
MVVSISQAYEPCSPHLTRQLACQNPPIPLSFILAHVPRASLPTLALISRRFCTTVQLMLYHTVELSAADADACIAKIAGVPRLAALMLSLMLSEYPAAHGTSFQLALALHACAHGAHAPGLRCRLACRGATLAGTPHAAVRHAPLCILRSVPRGPLFEHISTTALSDLEQILSKHIGRSRPPELSKEVASALSKYALFSLS